MKRHWSYALCLVPTILTLFGNIVGGVWAAANFVFIVLILGGLEWWAPQNRENSAASNTSIPEMLLWLSVPACSFVIGSLLYGVYSGTYDEGGLIWAILSTAFHTGAMGIVAAHEFIHRHAKSEITAGKFLLFLSFNPYFFVDHLRVHHRYVGTSRDHATARYGEHFYQFVWRSISGQLTEALLLEAELSRKNGHLAYGWHNYVIRQLLMQLLLLAILWLWGGWWVPIAFVSQALLANILLEYTNYIEHYGIVRPESSRVSYQTSWQCDTWMSRFLLYDLSRHADHHVHGSRPYHQLRSFSDAPVLPGGYASLILPALFPPWWFSLVHPKLDSEMQRLGK